MSTFNIDGGDTNQMWSQWIGSGSPGYFDVGNHEFVGQMAGALRFLNVTIPQGTTIQSARLNFHVGWKGSGSGNCKFRTFGIDEDNTSELSSYPLGRPATTVYVDADISLPSTGNGFNINVTSIVQEIIDRGGWNSGNAMGFICWDNGSPENVYHGESVNIPNASLEIILSSPSTSVSPTPSSSYSASPSITPSASPSVSISPSPSAMDKFFGLRIIKPEAVALGKNVFNTQEPFHFIFDSDYGTLKYFEKLTAQLSIDANAGDIADTDTISHNLGYYPFIEVFVSVYIGDPTGIYQYCPFVGAGASVFYNASYKITTTGIQIYGEINGVSTSVWTFDFLIFIYKNNLNL